MCQSPGCRNVQPSGPLPIDQYAISPAAIPVGLAHCSLGRSTIRMSAFEELGRPTGGSHGEGGIFCRTIPEAGSHATRRLLGRTGFFASARARTDRAMAERAAGAIAPGLERIAAAEARAAQTYRDSVRSPAQGGCHTHPKAFHAGRGGCHRIGCGQEEVRPSFGAASRRTKRSARSCGGSQMPCGCDFGDDIVRAMLRAEGGPVETASAPRQHQAALESVGRTVHSSNR